jgi:RNA polymerase-binding transcription factor DksA
MPSKVTKKTVVKKTAIKASPKSSIKGKGSAEQNKKKKSTVKAVTKKSAVLVKKEKEKKVTPKKKVVNKTESSTHMTKSKTPEVKALKEKAQPKVKTSVPAHVVTKAQEHQEHSKVKATTHIKGYSKKELEHFRKVILDKRDEIIEQLQNLKEQMLDPTTGEYINENSPYSLHMAEQGTDAMEREKTFLYAQRENKFLGYLEDALKRIDAGTYGICIECIDEPQHICDTCPLVPKARLEAVPHSQLCLPIKQRQEKK